MCDVVAGELILCFSRTDEAAHNVVSLLRERKIEHVEYGESLANKLKNLGLILGDDLQFEFHLVKVPAGQESWKTTYLQFFYKQALMNFMPKFSKSFWELSSRSDYQFTVSPNHLLTLGGTASNGNPISAKDFRFGGCHSKYKQAIGLSTAASASSKDKIRVLLLDSGIANDAPVTIADRRNIVDPKSYGNAPDDHGHGTALALLIHDLAPNTEFLIYKVADTTGRISEWDALAGMVAKSDAHVINLSMQFGLLNKNKGCPLCGRESQASRSAVFENVVNELKRRSPRPIVIASAGNYGGQELAFPARFDSVLAIGSIRSDRTLSSDCNSGEKDQTGDPHRNHFVLPGGESDPARLEPILTSTSGQNWTGSSFAAGFASGMVARILGGMGLQQFSFDLFLDRLRQTADTNLQPQYSNAAHGNGLMHF